jgi:hypothetical protein
MDFAEMVRLVRDELTHERGKHAEIVADLKTQLSAREDHPKDDMKIMIAAWCETSSIDCSMDKMIIVQDERDNTPPETSSPSISCGATTDVELTYWEQQRGIITVLDLNR